MASASILPCSSSAAVIHLTLLLQPLNEVAFFRTDRNRENRRRQWADDGGEPPSASSPPAPVAPAPTLSSVETPVRPEVTAPGKGASVRPIVFALPVSFVIRVNSNRATTLTHCTLYCILY